MTISKRQKAAAQQQLQVGSGDADLPSPVESPNKRLAKQYVDINGDVLVLSIDKRGRPALGLSLAGNRDASVMSVFVCGIRPESAAATDGRLRIGDELLEIDGHVLLGKSHLNAVPLINDACSATGGSVRLVVVRRPTNMLAMAVKPIAPPRSVPLDYWEANQKLPDTLITPSEMEMLAEGAIDSEQLLTIGRSAGMNGQQQHVGPYGVEVDCVLVKGKLGLGFAITEIEVADADANADDGDAVNGDDSASAAAAQAQPSPMHHSGVLVKHITERGPAEIDGTLRPGDRLLRANGVDLAEAAYDEALDCLRSLPAGEVRLTVARQPQQLPANESGGPSELHSDPDQQQQQQPPRPAMDGCNGLETVHVEIDKGEAGTLGIGIVGGSDTDLKCVVIYEILDSGAASRDQSLREGDRILSVDERDFALLTHNEAKAALRQCGRTVRMTVQRGHGPMSEAELYDFEAVELGKKPSRGFGFSIVGRSRDEGVLVSDIIRGGSAESDGRLQPGDRLLELNGSDVRLLPHVEVATRLKASQGRISMLVGRLKHVSAASRAKRRLGF